MSLLLSQGHMPTHQLLRKYDLMQFSDVTKAVRLAFRSLDRKWNSVTCSLHRCLFLAYSEGNLLLLNEALTKHETFFIRCGIFLILEKLKIITYRNLFKKVWVKLYLIPYTYTLYLNPIASNPQDADRYQCVGHLVPGRTESCLFRNLKYVLYVPKRLLATVNEQAPPPLPLQCNRGADIETGNKTLGSVEPPSVWCHYKVTHKTRKINIFPFYFISLYGVVQ